MTDPFADERIQFFLRNRDDITTWAAIERDVIAATKELLAQSQPSFEERLLAIDPDVLVGRNDGGPYERILARHEHWPGSVGLTLEWQHRSVDPLGATPPKAGVFWYSDKPAVLAARARFLQLVEAKPLQDLGFKVLDGGWPVLAFFKGEPDWWRDPDAFVATILDKLAAAWTVVAPAIDHVVGEPQVSDG